MKIFGIAIMPETKLLERDSHFYSEGVADAKWLKSKNLELEKNLQEAKEEPQKLRDEIDQLKATIRKQIEADLILISLKIILETLKDPKNPDIQDYRNQQLLYQSQLQAMSGKLSFNQPCIVQGLGLGSIF